MIESVITGTNAHLIATIAPLWIPEDAHVLDCTYGRGNFWTEFRPKRMATSDMRPQGDCMYQDDFTHMQWFNDRFDVVVFDPPYVVKGGRQTSGIEDMDNRYGLTDAPMSPAVMRQLHTAGMTECNRVLVPGGVLLMKVGDYISSGQYQSGLDHVTFIAAVLGLVKQDLFIHHSGTGPQPERERQVHSRRAHTYLVVYRKPAPRGVVARPPLHVLQSPQPTT